MMTIKPLPFRRDESGKFAGVVTLTLEQPSKPVVVLDHDLIQQIHATIDALPSDVRGLVLASGSSRVFVAGADLKTISEWDDDQLERYLAYGQRVFGMLAELPYPTAAAINGAALGGGLEIAMHCDGLIACPSTSGRPYPIGLPEAGLCLCPGWGGTNLLPARIDPAVAISKTALGKTMLFDEAVELKMFDAIADNPDDLLDVAKGWVVEQASTNGSPRREGCPSRWIGNPKFASTVLGVIDAVSEEMADSPAATAVLDAVHAGLVGGVEGWRSALKVERTRLVYLRNQPDARQALEAFFASSAKKK